MIKLLIFIVLTFQVCICVAQIKPCARTMPKVTLINILTNYDSENIALGKIKTDCNYNDTIKTLLILNLKPKWTLIKIDSFINERIKDRYKSLYVEDRIKITRPITLHSYKKAKDSILLNAYKEAFSLHQWRFKVNNSIVLNCGYLYIKEAKSILEGALSDSMDYDLSKLKLALARLGNKEFEHEITNNLPKLNNLDDDDWTHEFDKNGSILSYIATQESVFKFADYLVTDKYYEYTSNGRISLCSNRAIMFLSELILNKEFQNIIGNDIYNLPYEDININKKIIEDAKKWLTANKGKFEINRQFEPNL